MVMPRGLVWDLIAIDQASPALRRVAAEATATAAAMGRAQEKTATTGRSLGTVAATVGKIAAPLAVIGVVSIKMAADFQRSMTQIQTQAGASAAEVKSFSKALLSMSGQVAQSPDALATSLYHVYSALKKVGATGPQMLNTVKIAAEGAKVGNTDLEDTTNSLTATLASGIVKFNQAGKAMGYLNATVGAGDMKFSDLNEALGTGLLVTMKTFGVSMRDTGAALAIFGDNNIRGAEAATKLRMAVQDLAKPAANADQYLSQIGLSSDKLRASLEKGGLSGALTTLEKHLTAAGITGNKVGGFLEDAFTKKAGVGLAILTQRLKQFDEARNTEERAAKGFGSAWQATTHTLSFAFDRLKSELEAALISVGMKMLPAVTNIADTLGRDLPGAVAKVQHALQPLEQLIGGALTVAWHVFGGAVKLAAGALAAIGNTIDKHRSGFTSLAVVVGGLWLAFKGYTIAKTALTALDGLLGRMSARAASAAGAMNGFGANLRNMSALSAAGGLAMTGIGAALVGLTYNWQKSAAAAARAKEITQGYFNVLQQSKGAIDDLVVKQVTMNLATQGTYDAARKEKVSLSDVTQAALGNAKAYERLTKATNDPLLVGAAKEQAKALGDAQQQYKQYAAQTKANTTANQQNAAGARAAAGSYRNLAGSFVSAKQAAQELDNALKSLSGLLSKHEALDQYRQSLQDLKSQLDKHTHSLEGNSKAAVANRLAFDQVIQNALQYGQALKDQGAQAPRVRDALVAQFHALIDNAHQFGLTKDQVIKYLGQLHLLPKDITTKLSALDQASPTISSVEAKLAGIRDKTVRITATVGGNLFNAAAVMQQLGPQGYFAPHAAGGKIPPNTKFTVGEKGFEAGVSDSQGRVTIFSNATSRAMGIRPAVGYAGGTLSASALMGLILQAGFRGEAAKIMYGIVRAESGGRPMAHNYNPSTGDNSYGLAQINMLGSMGPARRAQYHLSSNAALYNPATNLRVAYAMSGHGSHFGDWTTFRDGAYRAYLGAATEAAKSPTIGAALRQSVASAGGSGASAAQTAAQAAAQKRQEARGSLIGALKSFLDPSNLSTVATSQGQFGNVLKAVRGVAGGAALIPRLRRDDAALNDAIRKRVADANRLAKAQANLAKARQNLNNEVAAVSSATRGGFDITSAGANATTGKVSVGAIRAQQTQELNTIHAWVAGIKKINRIFGKSAAGRGLVRQLAEAGPASYPQVRALAAAGPAALREIASTQQQINHDAGRFGHVIGQELFGGQIRADRRTIREVKVRLARDRRDVEHEAALFGEAVASKLNGMRIQIDDRGIARLVADGTKANKNHRHVKK